MVPCPSCRAENDDEDDSCFRCGRGLSAVIHGTVLAARYEVLGKIGRGGMGTVYKARDRVLDEIVALKVLRSDIAHSPDILRRFRSEIKLARKIGHRNVCRIYDYGEDGPLHFISMAFIDGLDLRRVVRQHGRLLHEMAYDVLIRVAEGLQAIHEEGIIHRDLKTPNIVLDSRGVVKVMDFGIAKEWSERSHTGGTRTGQIVGTPEYMSPEQIRGEKIDYRTDVYSLGVVAFELFTGRVPFQGDTPLATIMKQLQEEPPLEGPEAADLPGVLVPVLRRALAKARDERFASADEFAEALRRARGRDLPAPRIDTPAPGRAPVSAPAARSATARDPDAEPTDVSTPITPPPPITPTPPPSAPPPAPRAPVAAPRAARLPAAPPTPVPAPTRPTSLRRSMPSRRLARAWWAAGLGVVGLLAVGWALRVPASAPLPVEGARALAIPAAAPPSLAPSPIPTAMASPDSVAVAETSLPPPPVTAPPATLARRPTVRSPATPPAPSPAAAPSPVALESPAAPRPESPASATEAKPAGLLALTVKPPAEVQIDGQPLGLVSTRDIRLEAGEHVVTLEHPDYRPLRRKITIRSGTTSELTIDLAEKGVPKRR